jgi:hypothetical protein
LRTQSRLDESSKALSEAVDVLQRLRAQGDRTEATAVGLGVGLVSQARVASSENRQSQSLALAHEAVDVLKPFAKPQASPSLRRASGLANTFLGFVQMQSNQNEAALETLAQARDAYRGVDGLKDDLPAAAGYAEASSWQMNALQNLGRNDEVRQIAEDAIKATRRVLERRPGDMAALRAEGLILNTVAAVDWNDLHVRRALEASRQSARDWEAIVRLDPTNQIAWNNLADARIFASGTLWALGDVDRAREQARAALDVGQRVKESAFIGNVLAFAAGYVARYDADAGDRVGATSAMASNRRFATMAVSAVGADSFGRTYLPELLGYAGFPGFGFAYGAYAVPFFDGDFEAVRALARGSAKRLEAIGNVAATQELPRNLALEGAYRTAADASYRLNDYVAADGDIQRALALRKEIPTRTLSDERDAAVQTTLAAMIAARLGRDAEARRLIDPVLEFHRKLYAREDSDDLTQHVEFAQALYASALAGSPQRAAELRQAAVILDALPPAMRRLISISRTRARIADAQRS